MRYLTMVKMAEDIGPAPAALVETMGAAMRDAFADGSMIDAGGLAGTADSTEFKLREGRVTVSDGPYAETKEVVGGYAIIEARNDAEAVEAARRVIEIHKEHWPGWEGAVEVRRIYEPEEGPPQGTLEEPPSA
jgi:hypothetical protein